MEGGNDANAGLAVGDGHVSDGTVDYSPTADQRKLSQAAESDEDMYTDDEPLRYACFTTDVFDLRANNHAVRSG